MRTPSALTAGPRAGAIPLILSIALGAGLHARQEPSWTERVRDATVAIGAITYNSAGEREFALGGTGIVVGLPEDSSNNAWLVTAKRVLASRSSVQLRFAWFSERPLNEYLGISLQLQAGAKPLWIAHPDAAVDLAAVQLVMPKGADTGRPGLTTIPLENLAAAEDVFDGASILALGYPQIEPQFRTRSTVRAGVVAWTDPREPLSQPFLIDAMILPGNIGGPVFRVPTGIDRNGNLQSGGRVGFLGIVSQVQFVNRPIVFRDEARRSTEPLEMRSERGTVKPLTQYVSGLGLVEPAARIVELLRAVAKSKLPSPR